MKKSVYIIALTSLCLLGSCNLDREIQTDISPQYAYRNFDYTMMRANGLYGPLLRGFKYIDDAMMASATDEAEFVVQWANVQNFNQGSWSERLNPDFTYISLRKRYTSILLPTESAAFRACS